MNFIGQFIGFPEKLSIKIQTLIILHATFHILQHHIIGKRQFLDPGRRRPIIYLFRQILQRIQCIQTEAYKSLGGPLSIGSIFPDEWNWPAFWEITALLSIILAVMNILPIPALDGGHVLFLLVEVITGRKPGDKFMTYAQIAGMLLLFTLIIYATGNDIYRLFIK